MSFERAVFASAANQHAACHSCTFRIWVLRFQNGVCAKHYALHLGGRGGGRFGPSNPIAKSRRGRWVGDDGSRRSYAPNLFLRVQSGHWIFGQCTVSQCVWARPGRAFSTEDREESKEISERESHA